MDELVDGFEEDPPLFDPTEATLSMERTPELWATLLLSAALRFPSAAILDLTALTLRLNMVAIT